MGVGTGSELAPILLYQRFNGNCATQELYFGCFFDDVLLIMLHFKMCADNFTLDEGIHKSAFLLYAIVTFFQIRKEL